MERHVCQEKSQCPNHKKLKKYSFLYRCNCGNTIKALCSKHAENNKSLCNNCKSGIFTIIDDIEECFRQEHNIQDIDMLKQCRQEYSNQLHDDWIIEDKKYGLGHINAVLKIPQIMAKCLSAKP